jgi:hypothetical protein
MEIKPTYVTFEQAKLLKEKGFDVPTLSFYVIDESEYGDLEEFIQNPNDNYPTLEDNTLFDTLASSPEQWQVVEWLRVNHGIWIRVEPDWDGDWWGQIKSNNIPDARIGKWTVITAVAPYKSPQEAYSAAFDYILNNNLI